MTAVPLYLESLVSFMSFRRTPIARLTFGQHSKIRLNLRGRKILHQMLFRQNVCQQDVF